MKKIRRKNTILFKRKRDNCKRIGKRSKLIEYLQKDLRNSTIHGVPYIVNPDIHYYVRLFWAIALSGATIFIVYLLAFQFQRYNNNPTVMSVQMDYFNWNVSYPAITLCPLYKADNTLLQSVARQLQSKTNESLKSIAKFLETIATVSLDSLFLYDYDNIDSIKIDPTEYAELAAKVFNSNVSYKIITTTNAAVSVEAAMTEVGMCLVINSNVAVFDNPLTWNTSNEKYSKRNIDLSVYDKAFFTQINEYNKMFTIYIHSPDEIILISTPSHKYIDEGFLKITATVWSSTISDTLRSGPMDVRKCRLINEPVGARYSIYSYQHCLLECRIRIIKKLCKCIPHFYKPLSGEDVCNLTQLACITQNRKQIVQYSEISKQEQPSTLLIKSYSYCNCLRKCDTEIYQRDDENTSEGLISAVRIVLKPFPKVKIVREAILNFYDILLRSGGVLNLCVGTSVISIMEIILIFIKIMLIVIKL